MQFLFPGFLAALITLAIPIIIHLFYFRRFKKVYFTNVRFLKEVREESSARRKLRNLLVLAMRLLALALLVLAFARPFLPRGEEVVTGNKAVSIFVDNSFSMSALSQDVPLLTKAKQRAREIVEAYSSDDRFQILTHDFEGRHQYLLSQEDALSLIDEISSTPAVHTLSQVTARQKQALQRSESQQQSAYIISDFQRQITDIEQYADSTLNLSLIPLQAVQEKNIAIDSAWFIAPVQMVNQTNALVVQVTNYSSEAAENVRLALMHEGQEKPIGTLSIPPGATTSDTVNITVLRTGWHQAELQLTDYPITFDDHFYFTFYVPEVIDVLVINESTPSRFLQAAFAGAGIFQVTNQPRQGINYNAFPDYELIIANDLQSISSGLGAELRQYMSNGGNVLLFPSEQSDLESYNRFLRQAQADELQQFEETAREASIINTSEFVFNDVFENVSSNLKLPDTRGNYQITRLSSRSGEPLITYRDGSPFLLKYPNDQGHLYFSTAPLSLDYNNLVRNAEIFVPMLYKMSISSGAERQIAYFIGKDQSLRIAPRQQEGEMVFRLRGEGKEFIPGMRNLGKSILLNVAGEIEKAGFYELTVGDKEEALQLYAFNYDRRESDLSYLNAGDLKSQVGPEVAVIDGIGITDLTPLIGEQSQGVQLWRWCLLLALGFLATESLLLRFWK